MKTINKQLKTIFFVIILSINLYCQTSLNIHQNINNDSNQTIIKKTQKFNGFKEPSEGRSLLYIYSPSKNSIVDLSIAYQKTFLRLANEDNFKYIMWEPFNPAISLDGLGYQEYMVIDVPIGKNEVFLHGASLLLNLNRAIDLKERANALHINTENKKIYCVRVEPTVGKTLKWIYGLGYAIESLTSLENKISLVSNQICKDEISDTYEIEK